MATQALPETEIAVTSKKPAIQYVYFFGGGKADGNGKMKDELGGKGAGLAEMTNAGLPVPPGFTIQTEACREYMRGAANPQIDGEMHPLLGPLEKMRGKRSGNPRFAYDSYRRLIQMFGDVVLDVGKKKFEHIFDGVKEREAVKFD